ncbi:efflux RND transporter periplasmic adaptor subunit [Pelomonas sp. SE-A7]|uniref:efflux RND transporter periplasmic adaptor subunit n=1 Tax=Pelomonas sp. SE-A7 TaxID=3054953 RepID=UPI00259C9BE1|nr:efflux RND transporter periplasmic adaptor subunit [Pelomonas sp. SE-A7]MDM4765306.1 efflux RND transporter periplasmic adaptor subunit [Pelomonas sp. SE-A7]
MTKHHIPVALAVVVAALTSLSGCQQGNAEKKDASKDAPALQLAPEDRLVMGEAEHGSGPLITGAVQPEKRADLRAELSAVVLHVLKENGETVRRGDLLVQLDTTSIRDSLSSAEEAARAARENFEQAERQFQRQKALQAQGMISQQALEDSANRRTTTQSDKVAAEARLVAARQQMARTEVRAPFDGVVSERRVSPGDTAQIGKELLKVIDPASMRFEGFVSADRRAELKLGQDVDLRIHGANQERIEGRIRRIDVSANPVSRQIAVLVDLNDKRAASVTGLYGEGFVRTTKSAALMLDDADMQRDGDQAYAWIVQGGKLHRQPIKLGDRDERRGEYVVSSGLKVGDIVLRNPSRTLVEGAVVTIKAAAAAGAASATKPAAAASTAS